MGIITLLTDFGTRDEYVGVVKGVILGINPGVCIVDITHEVSPGDVVSAAYTVAAAFKYFPMHSIHLVVVDPGVGSERDIIATRLAGHFFLAPNNGVLSALFETHDNDIIIRVSNERYFLHPVSKTFHGRDIFAPVAAHLSAGLDLSDFGPSLPEKEIIRLSFPDPENKDTRKVTGRVTAVDRFGNIITNIEKRHIDNMLNREAEGNLVIEAGNRRIQGLSSSYSQVPSGQPLAIIGSRQYLEIAVRDDNASEILDLKKDALVAVYVQTACQPIKRRG